MRRMTTWTCLMNATIYFRVSIFPFCAQNTLEEISALNCFRDISCTQICNAYCLQSCLRKTVDILKPYQDFQSSLKFSLNIYFIQPTNSLKQNSNIIHISYLIIITFLTHCSNVRNEKNWKHFIRKIFSYLSIVF